VLDEPTDLPEGAQVELVAMDDDFDPEERARLVAAIDEGIEGIEDFERGDHIDGFELIAQMRAARSAMRGPGGRLLDGRRCGAS
jgi:hypothetical protein